MKYVTRPGECLFQKKKKKEEKQKHPLKEEKKQNNQTHMCFVVGLRVAADGR